MKNITDMKTTLERINNRSDGTEEWVCDQEDRVVEIIQLEKSKQKKNEKE